MVVNLQLATNSIDNLTLKLVSQSAEKIDRIKIHSSVDLKNEANVKAFMFKLQPPKDNQVIDVDDDDDCQFTIIPDDPPPVEKALEKPALQIGNVVSLFDQNIPGEAFEDNLDDIEPSDFQMM
jgi:hypothetical protein